MRTISAVLAAMLACWSSSCASADCTGATLLGEYAGKRVRLAQEALFFRTSNLELDIDGSPLAYGVRDQGLENICNGLAPLRPPECRGKVRDACYAACQQAFRQWDGAEGTLKDSMCAIGLGGGSCAKPSVRLQPAPNQRFFVSETSVHTKPPRDMPLSSWVLRQEAQLDSLATPYFVIPSGFRSKPWDATPGDVGVVVMRPDGQPIPFIVGDTGGALDEASGMLLAQLRRVDTLPREMGRSAHGEQVERLTGAMRGDFRIVIFRHTAPYADETRHRALVLDKTSAELPDFIRATATARLEAIGGREQVLACTD